MFICFLSVDRNEFMFDHMCANVLSKIQNVWDFLAMCYICIFALCNIYKSAFRRWNYLKAGRRRLLGSTPYCHQTGLSVRIQIWGGGWQRRNNPKLSRLQLFTRKTFQTKCAKPFLATNIKHRKNCECCPGHYLIVSHYSSMSWLRFRNLSVIVTSVIKSQIH